MRRDEATSLTIAPEERERDAYHAVERSLRTTPARVVTSDGTSVDLPPRLIDALRLAAHILGEDRPLLVASLESTLTTQQAAAILGVSRPTMVRLLESERAIPFEGVGAQRRLRLADLLAYQRAMYQRQRDLMDELTRVGEELGGYDLPSASERARRPA